MKSLLDRLIDGVTGPIGTENVAAAVHPLDIYQLQAQQALKNQGLAQSLGPLQYPPPPPPTSSKIKPPDTYTVARFSIEKIENGYLVFVGATRGDTATIYYAEDLAEVGERVTAVCVKQMLDGA